VPDHIERRPDYQDKRRSDEEQVVKRHHVPGSTMSAVRCVDQGILDDRL
jgi:hypothetical protein